MKSHIREIRFLIYFRQIKKEFINRQTEKQIVTNWKTNYKHDGED